jgi:hypothetical protein
MEAGLLVCMLQLVMVCLKQIQKSFGVPTPMGCCFPKKGPAVDAWNFLSFVPTRLFCQERFNANAQKINAFAKQVETVDQAGGNRGCHLLYANERRCEWRPAT